MQTQEINQSDMLKKIEKALDDAGLSGRQVTPLMRVRVVGLTSKCSQRKNRPREGVVTIWNPTEKQVIRVTYELFSLFSYVFHLLNILINSLLLI